MSVVTEHLERRGCAFEALPHRQAYTSIDEARALGADADEVLKTLALRTESRYALLVIPASRRLDLHLAREAVGDGRARLASEEELADSAQPPTTGCACCCTLGGESHITSPLTVAGELQKRRIAQR
jgi:prolyl-tRNA editing enzyme YbaK/EbsC (Cys-tRNA(Pro) deacylase)